MAKVLLDEELSNLARYGEGWQTVAYLVVSNSVEPAYKQTLDETLATPRLKAYLDNQTNISEDVVQAMATVVSLAMSYQRALRLRDVSILYEPKGRYSSHFVALTEEIENLRSLLEAKSKSCWKSVGF
ncbi:hypothetical protein [Comamonas kerstersii]|uniref:Uncharacterized protein n=1 Tax=Comamonas kerstersii TaxID=225992 RepID=A0A6A1R4M4_9BURK|nr:hypothetical protein [Comamonas kerstersii]KAB0587539.1 hypothetical protein F7P80_07205 [Comamonas kerstersii]